MHDPCDFFVAGGTLRPQALSYVVRPADQDLYESARRGEFCYVLTARQVGKSSLMVRTAERLRAEETHSAIVDLTSIGTVPAEEWYLGLLTRIRQALQLKIDLAEWWAEHKALSLPQRFSEFLRDVVLAEVQVPIVIFIDEIDSTLNLPFRDDFFAAIRAIYNARASESVFRRLTFVLLGVATPTDLIRDRDRTPFNIGHAIALGELSYENATALRDGLEICHPGHGDTILRRIFYWTNGHPYLTQRLCLAAANRDQTDWNNARVDALVEETFLSEEGRHDTNLTFIQDRIAACLPAERRDMLRLYTQVLAGKARLDDDRSSIQNRLELYGLIRVKGGQIRVHNRIYQQVFDREWIRVLTPADFGHRTTIIAVLAAVFLTAAVVILIITRPKPSDIRRDLYVDMFTKATTDTQRLEALYGLYGLEPGYWERAAELFYGLADAQQESLFDLAGVQRSRNTVQQLVTVINGLSRTLDWMPERRDRTLMSQMIATLKESKGFGLDTEVGKQLEILWLWQEGRDRTQNSEYGEAINNYSEALKLIDDHPVILYDRAKASVDKLPPDYEGALNDLEQMVLFITDVFPTPTPPPTSGPLTTVSVTVTAQATGTPTVTPATGSPSSTEQGGTTTATADPVAPVIDRGGTPTQTVPPEAIPTRSDRFQSRFINADGMMVAVAQLFADVPDLTVALNNKQTQYPRLLATARRLGIAKFLTTSCVEPLVDGKFDSGLANWQVVGDPAGVALVSTPARSAPYALKLGALDQNLNAFTMVRQLVTIPTGYPQVTLQAWVYTQSQAGAGADYQQVALLNASGGLLFVPWQVQQNNTAWQQLSFNVSAFAGQTVFVSFSVYNDDTGGRTAMFVDDVRLNACTPGAEAAATPAETWPIMAGPGISVTTQTMAPDASTSTIAYRGRLADTVGAPLTGTYAMIFRLYSASSDGMPLWEETWTGSNSVMVRDGLFNVMLGSLTPVPRDTITGNDPLYLGITVGTYDELAPIPLAVPTRLFAGTRLVTETPTSATRALTVTPQPSDTATPTSTRTPSPARTATRRLPSITPVPTEDVMSTLTPNATLDAMLRAPARPSSTPAQRSTSSPAPILISPNDGQSVTGEIIFSWEWEGPDLTSNQGFEVRIWREGQADHYGAAQPVSATSAQINVGAVFGVAQGGPGVYLWTVALVQLNPYQRIGPEAIPRALFVQ